MSDELNDGFHTFYGVVHVEAEPLGGTDGELILWRDERGRDRTFDAAARAIAEEVLRSGDMPLFEVRNRRGRITGGTLTGLEGDGLVITGFPARRISELSYLRVAWSRSDA